MDYIKRVENWLNSKIIDQSVKDEILNLQEDEKEDRFYKDLEFGTAGLRGIIGNGSNRMNKYTVGLATQGIANYINSKNLSNKGVVISYDSRIKSDEFAKQTANILLNNGIKVYLFKELRPVPELSFTVRDYGATAGIMITASHNPPQYNGYKVYWDDGAQISSPIDKEIMEFVKNVSFEDIKFEENSINKYQLEYIDDKQDEKYLNILKNLILDIQAINKAKDKLKIVYTPFHGTGNTLVEKLLKEVGFKNIYIVEEQKEPDGNFPTILYPNPEDDKAFELALKLANKVDADIILANDPDADRLGVWAKDKSGIYRPFSGNQSALIIAYYRLSKMKENNILPDNAMMINSIVTSNLARAIAKDFNIELYETLTGFKNICRIIKERSDKKYVFGFEESYGCLIDDYARDKDGISAVLALCELASYCYNNGMSLFDYLDKIYDKYGYYTEKTISIIKEGSKGQEQINEIINRLRNKTIDNIGGKKVKIFMDVLNDIKKDENNNITSTGLSKSNVLYYDLEDDFFACVRPSGTEPKIRIYMGTKANTKEDSIKAMDKLEKDLFEIINN